MTKRRSLIPTLETLEGRDCPSVDAFVVGHTLFVRGDDADNVVSITDDGLGGVSADIDGTTVDGTDIRRINVQTRDGNDTVTYTASASLSASRHLGINLGKGDDTFTMDAASGITSGSLNVSLHGHQGDNTGTITLGTIDEGASALFQLHGGNGDDDFTATFDGELNGKLGLHMHGGSGSDTLTGEITVAEGSTGKLAAALQGGSGSDNLTLNVTDGSETDGETGLAFFRALIQGGSGNNTVESTDNVTVKGKK
jgi:hypothetical protein